MDILVAQACRNGPSRCQGVLPWIIVVIVVQGESIWRGYGVMLSGLPPARGVKVLAVPSSYSVAL